MSYGHCENRDSLNIECKRELCMLFPLSRMHPFSVSMYTNVFIKMINPFRCAYDKNLDLLCLQWCMKSECVPSDIPIDVSGKEFVLFRFLNKMSKELKFQISSKRIKDKTFILIQSKCPHVIVCI